MFDLVKRLLLSRGFSVTLRETIMIGLAKVVAVIGALLAAPVAYVAYSASQNGDNGNHYGQIKNGNNGNNGHMSTALRVLWLVPGVLVFSLPVAFSG